LVLGGDGYLGWPTALHFLTKGDEVAVLDNFARRRYHAERGTDSLTPIASLDTRLQRWTEVSGRHIQDYRGDVTDWSFLEHVIKEFRPEALIHYAEQPSAPYSMIDRARVDAGVAIGRSSNSGNTIGNDCADSFFHLQFEVRRPDGSYADPYDPDTGMLWLSDARPATP
jgi:NAD(P)-dependent dehydrogenase (short-subunit alcohol dehydrogenase family)